MAQETGEVTGTKDKDYNLIWFTEASLSNVLRLETYIEDAEREGDSDLAKFFEIVDQSRCVDVAGRDRGDPWWVGRDELCADTADGLAGFDALRAGEEG